MSTEFGLFNDEGLVEGGFYSTEEATAAINDRYSPDDELTVEECCSEHPDEPRLYCQACDEDEDEEEEDNDEGEE